MYKKTISKSLGLLIALLVTIAIVIISLPVILPMRQINERFLLFLKFHTKIRLFSVLNSEEMQKS